MFRQQNGSVDPMEVPINRSVLGDIKPTFKKTHKKKIPQKTGLTSSLIKASTRDTYMSNFSQTTYSNPETTFSLIDSRH